MKKKKRVKYDGAAPLPILLYLISVCTALMYTICNSQMLPCTVIMSALTAGIFLLFYKIRFRPLATTLSIFGLILAAWAVGSAAGSWAPSEDISFMNFLFSASAEFHLIYAAAAIFIFSLVIGFIGCYFSVLSPRPCFLMLLMFIPMILSSRTSRELPVYFMLIMTGCFVFASANLAVPCPAEGQASFEERTTRSRRIVFSCAAAAVLSLIVAVMPKSDETPMEELLDSFVPENTGYYNASGLTNFTNHSSINTGSNDPTGKLLFTVHTDSPGLLKSWAFDLYGENGWTVYLDEEHDFDTGYANWDSYSQRCIQSRLLDFLFEYGEDMSEDSHALLEGIVPEEPDQERLTISVKDGSSTRVIIHPAGEITVDLPEKCGRSYRNPRGDIFTEFALPVNGTYSVVHSVNHVNEEFLRRLDYDSFERLLSDARESGAIYEYTEYALITEMQQAQKYYEVVGSSGITPRIQALADEITAGLTSDYDKAKAIERWFGSAGFVYDLKFVPDQKGAEYFLFDSRRGICSDFASAMTLLARAAGLPARYCEGYAVPDSAFDKETGLYNITDAEAHAFTQIYFPGGGWIDFDGTRYAAKAGEEKTSIPLWLYVLAVAALSGILIVMFNKPLGWLWFNITYPVRSRSGKVRGVYLYARRIAAEMSGADEKNLASGEVKNIISDQLGMPREAECICTAADALFYSPEKTAEPDPELLKYLRALNKRRRRLKK